MVADPRVATVLRDLPPKTELNAGNQSCPRVMTVHHSVIQDSADTETNPVSSRRHYFSDVTADTTCHLHQPEQSTGKAMMNALGIFIATKKSWEMGYTTYLH